MVTAYRKKIIIQSDGRIEIQDPAFRSGAEAEIIVLVESSPGPSKQDAADEWKLLFNRTREVPQIQDITEAEIAAEIAACRSGKVK
jgi:hypothetical protein